MNKPNGREEAAIAIIEHQQLSLREMGCPLCTSDHPSIVRLSKWGAERLINLPNYNPGLLLISGSNPSWKGLGCSKLRDVFEIHSVFVWLMSGRHGGV